MDLRHSPSPSRAEFFFVGFARAYRRPSSLLLQNPTFGTERGCELSKQRCGFTPIRCVWDTHSERYGAIAERVQMAAK